MTYGRIKNISNVKQCTVFVITIQGSYNCLVFQIYKGTCDYDKIIKAHWKLNLKIKAVSLCLREKSF